MTWDDRHGQFTGILPKTSDTGKPLEKQAEQFPSHVGWQCPACGRGNAPSVRVCDCVETGQVKCCKVLGR